MLQNTMKSIVTLSIILAACFVGSFANPEEFAGNAYRKTVSKGGAGGSASANGKATGNYGSYNGNGGSASANGGSA